MKSQASSLKTRKRPTQKRSLQTFERILGTATKLLEEVGFDKLTTNLICEQAGVSPPALYRYFPDKYAVLAELGEQLMDHQNDDLKEWLSTDAVLPITPEKIEELLNRQYDVTRREKGGRWIMRSLRSTPRLAEILQKSHDHMAAIITEHQLIQMPEANRNTLQRRNHIMLQTGYAILEMLIDNPDMDAKATLHDTALMLSALQ